MFILLLSIHVEIRYTGNVVTRMTNGMMRSAGIVAGQLMDIFAWPYLLPEMKTASKNVKPHVEPIAVAS